MTASANALVIVGSGLAGWTVARELRKTDLHTPITLVTRDGGDFYSKPMLSNALSSGKTAAQLVGTPGVVMAAQLGVELMDYTEVTALNPDKHCIHISQGAVPYQRLVLALGADPVRLPLLGTAADRVLSVNDLHDYAAFRTQLHGAQRVTVIGAGLIGCEFANDLANAGYAVDVVDPAVQPLARLLPADAGQLLQHALAGAGVRFHWGTSVNAVHTRSGGLQVELVNGRRIDTDLVLSAVGLRPRTALARAAGLTTGRGIAVNRQLQTSHPDIYALGDVAEVEGQCLPYVLPLMQAARTLAAHLGGQPVRLRYQAMPVTVKTPALPVVVSPPAPGTPGRWQTDVTPDGFDARFVGSDGSLLGFALGGPATAHKAVLQKDVPVLLD